MAGICIRRTAASEKGYGLRNVHERIRLTYGAPYLEIESEPDRATPRASGRPPNLRPGEREIYA